MANELLIFLHGLGENPTAFQPQVEHLPADLPAIAPWLTGLRPGAAKGAFSLAAAADEVRSVIDQHGATRAYICGHALGAMVALQCAVDDDRIAGLVLAAAQLDPPRWALKAQKVALMMASTKKLAVQGVNKQALLRAMDRLGEIDLSPRLGELKVPTLLVIGGGDKSNLPAAKLIAARAPGARLEIIPGAGHKVYAEAPVEFNRLLYEFIAQRRQQG